MQWDRTGSDMFGFYNELIHLRMKHEAFTSEKVTFIISSEPKKLLVYVRKGGGESFLVIINFSNEPLSFNLKIPPAPAAEYVFGDAASIAGNGDSFHNMSLNAYGYLILKLK
jgi:cyclomaltodextrinase